jgi:hypothetical protein
MAAAVQRKAIEGELQRSVPASVPKTCLVRLDNNKYSVDASAVGRPAEIHAYADRIVIHQDGRIVAEHPLVQPQGYALRRRSRIQQRFNSKTRFVPVCSRFVLGSHMRLPLGITR